MKFKKKPVVIDAVLWNGIIFDNTPDWMVSAINAPVGSVGFMMHIGDDIFIETLEGQMKASPGDWIIRGVKGEIYPCKPDIFDLTYEPA